MKIKLSKNKKIILLISGLGILTTSIVTPILVINNKKNKQEKENSEDLNKINEIIAKIKDKDILIAANVSTQNQSEIQNAIKDRLKKENQTLNEDDFSKIIINDIESLILGNRIEITLIIKVRNTTKELTINVEKINLLKNSNIDDGVFGTIFQDSFKNLWAMGKGTPLQVFKANSSGDGYVNTWVDDENVEGLLNGSNITNGFGGKIFQDSFKNLWAMGRGTPLQVLKANSSGDGYVTTGWIDNISQGLTNGSNINDGECGSIFQDKFKNLWAMGKSTSLQVLKAKSDGNGYATTGWTNDSTQGLLNGSNINDGECGSIFQDKFKNLWVIGFRTPLQVLKAKSDGNGYATTDWTNDSTQELLKGSNITNGALGTIFQDTFGNLWTKEVQQNFKFLKQIPVVMVM